MKNLYKNWKGFLLMLFLAAFVFGFTGCAKKIMFEQSGVVPGAEASVKIKKDGNNNYDIHIDALHLAESKRLPTPKAFYLVWMQTDQNTVKNLGLLNSSSSLLSKTLKASLHTVTPYKPTRIYVTAEDDATLTYPTGETVLTTGNL